MPRTFIQLPANISDPAVLRRFLDLLIQQIDIAFGNRGDQAFATDADVSSDLQALTILVNNLISSLVNYSLIDGTRNYTGIVSYNSNKTFTSGTQIVSKKYVDDSLAGYATEDYVTNALIGYATENYVTNALLDYSLVDGTRDYTGIVSYDSNKTFTSDTQIVSKKYVDDNSTKNLEQSAITDLGLTISDPPTQTEVQDISDKVDEILDALRNSNIIAT